MTIVCNMTLIEAGTTKVLCGFDDEQTSVFVLRKQSTTVYHLHRIPVSEASQALRAILAASEREGETLVILLATPPDATFGPPLLA